MPAAFLHPAEATIHAVLSGLWKEPSILSRTHQAQQARAKARHPSNRRSAVRRLLPLLTGLLLVLAGPYSAMAQGMQAMTFQTVPPLAGNPGGATACAIQFVGRTLVGTKPQQIHIVEGSLSIFSKGYGMVKAAFKTGLLSDGVAGLRPSELQISWVRVASSAPITPYPGTRLIPGDTAGYQMFLTNFDSMYLAMNELLKDKMLWISFANAGGASSVFSGPVDIDPATPKQFLACVSTLASTATPTAPPTGTE